MYMKVLIISLIISIFAVSHVAAAENTRPTFTADYNINLRSAPTINSERIALIIAGTTIEVTDTRDGEWFAVYYNGHNGYVYAEFLTAVAPTPEARVETEAIVEAVETIDTSAPEDPTPIVYEETVADTPQEDEAEQTTFIATARLNLRPTPSTDGERIALINIGSVVDVLDFRDGQWYRVSHNGQVGYVYAQFLRELPNGQTGAVGRVEMIEWSVARNIIPQNVPLTVIDVRTGLSFQMISFSHGNHADIFPATPQDTEIMRQAFGGRWSWDTRPVLMLVGDRTFAASMSGMPHGGGGNRGNNMNGHVCMHFLNSRTHNGNRSHERDHQATVREAYNTASQW